MSQDDRQLLQGSPQASAKHIFQTNGNVSLNNTSDMSAISSSIPLSNNSSNAEMKSSKGGFADGIISQIRITIEKGTKFANDYLANQGIATKAIHEFLDSA